MSPQFLPSRHDRPARDLRVDPPAARFHAPYFYHITFIVGEARSKASTYPVRLRPTNASTAHASPFPHVPSRPPSPIPSLYPLALYSIHTLLLVSIT